MLRFLGFSLALMAAAAAAGAADWSERFDDYTGMDPMWTDAFWNVFDGRLEAPRVEDAAGLTIVALEAMPDGGTVELAMQMVATDDLRISLQRRDSDGNALWRERLPVATVSRFLGWADIEVVGEEIVVVWASAPAPAGVYAARYDAAGSMLWSAPRRVDQSPDSSLPLLPAVAGLPDGGVAVAWMDDRAGTGQQRLHAQRLDPAGLPVWGTSDLLVQSGGGADDESWPRLAADDLGRSFILWEQSFDLRLMRIEADGTPAGPVGLVATADAAGSQRNARLAVVSGVGLFVAYEEDLTPDDQRLEMAAVDFAGSRIWPDDVLVHAAAEPLMLGDLVVQGDGLAVLLTAGSDASGEAWLDRVSLDGTTPWAGPRPFVTADGLRSIAAVAGAERPDGELAAAVTRSNVAFGSDSWLAVFDPDGEPLWPAPRRLRGDPGPAFGGGQGFARAGLATGGYRMVWVDGR